MRLLSGPLRRGEIRAMLEGMYVARQFSMDPELAMSHATEIGLGEFVTHGPDGLDSTLLPFTVRREPEGTWVVETHMARVNPQWRLGADSSQERDALIIVSGPNAHISGLDMPPEPADARLPRVPTWNYLTIHLRGELTAHAEPQFKERHLREMVERFEPEWRVGKHSSPTLMGDALPILVGVSVRVREVVAKAKLSQNLSSQDLQHTIESLRRREGQDAQQAHRVADLMAEISLPYVREREARAEQAATAAGLDLARHRAAPSGKVYDPETSGF